MFFYCPFIVSYFLMLLLNIGPKNEDFFLLNWEQLVVLTKTKSYYFSFVKYAVCIILSRGILKNCLLLWKSALRTVDIFEAVTSNGSKNGDFFLWNQTSLIVLTKSKSYYFSFVKYAMCIILPWPFSLNCRSLWKSLFWT